MIVQRFAFLSVIFTFLVGCSKGEEFQLKNCQQDIPSEVLSTYQSQSGTVVDEELNFFPFLYFNVNSARKLEDQFDVEGFTQGPLHTYMSSIYSRFNKDGELLYTAKWKSWLFDILYSSYTRRYKENGAWVEEKHVGYLLGLFGHCKVKEGSFCSIFMIPFRVDN